MYEKVAIRVALVYRDGPECFWCDAPTSLDTFVYLPRRAPGLSPRRRRNLAYRTIDHLIPRADGGTHDLRNLVIACAHCNNFRGRINAVEWAIQKGKLDKLIAHLDQVLTPARAEATVGASMEASHG